MSKIVEFVASRRTTEEKQNATQVFSFLEGVPFDVFSIICDFLDARSLLSLACTSSHFNAVCSADSLWMPILTERYGVTVFLEKTGKEAYLAIEKGSLPVQQLSVAERFDEMLNSADRRESTQSSDFLGFVRVAFNFIRWNATSELNHSPEESRQMGKMERRSKRVLRWGVAVPSLALSWAGAIVGGASGVVVGGIAIPAVIIGRNMLEICRLRTPHIVDKNDVGISLFVCGYFGILAGTAVGKGVGHAAAVPFVVVGEGVVLATGAASSTVTATTSAASRASSASSSLSSGAKSARDALILAARKRLASASSSLAFGRDPAVEGLMSSTQLCNIPLDQSALDTVEGPIEKVVEVRCPVLVQFKSEEVRGEAREDEEDMRESACVRVAFYSAEGQLIFQGSEETWVQLMMAVILFTMAMLTAYREEWTAQLHTLRKATCTTVLSCTYAHLTSDSVGDGECLYLSMDFVENVHTVVVYLYEKEQLYLRGTVEIMPCVSEQEEEEDRTFTPIALPLYAESAGNMNTFVIARMDRAGDTWALRTVRKALMAGNEGHLLQKLTRYVTDAVSVYEGDVMRIHSSADVRE